MLIFQIVCLCFAMFVLQSYATMGIYSRKHRLLPVFLALIILYFFYEVILCINGEKATFAVLEDLLLVQLIYLLLHYIQDVSERRFHLPTEAVLFLSLFGMDVGIFVQYQRGGAYRTVFAVLVWSYTILILALAAWAYVKGTAVKREHYVEQMLYLALAVPGIAVHLRRLEGDAGRIVLSVSLLFSCGVIFYLMRSGRLTDSALLLQKRLYETSGIPTILLDNEYYYLDSNAAAKEVFQEEFLAQEKHKALGEAWLDNVRKIFANPQQYRELERNGKYYRYEPSVVYEQKHRVGYMLTFFDITKERRETRKQEALKEQAQELTKQKSRFLAVMSHDLRSPVHAIIGVSDILLAKWEISAKDRSLLRHVRDAGNILLNHVNEILTFSRLESGKLELSEEPYCLETILEELAEECVINLQSKPVELHVCLMNKHPGELLGDKLKVRGIIQNLLSNAVRYTEKGEIRCEISCALCAGEDRVLLHCRVSDTGSGMDEKQLAEIFEEYVTSAEDIEAGAGLGLSIVKQLARLMDGTVRAESDGHSGSAIMVDFYQGIGEKEFLPPREFSRETVLRKKVRWTEGILPAFRYPEARVLLADDMEINRRIFRELVTPWGFQMDVVLDGTDAVEAARTKEYQLIFLDQMMPRMSGTEAAERIREFSGVPMIALTADLSDGVREDCMEHGFTDFLEKPIDMSLLKEVLEQYLPAELARKPLPRSGQPQESFASREGAAYRRTLETYVQEVNGLFGQLRGDAGSNLDGFRVKVHGIKGASRQLGRFSMGESAEVMEMAAKTENRAYLQRHLEDFLEELSETLKEAEEELVHIGVREQLTMGGGDLLEKELWSNLKEGFDTFRLDRIEEALQELTSRSLSPEEEELLAAAREAYLELDYEEGSRILGKK